MKKIAIVFAGAMIMGLTACNDNAASKIKKEEAKEASASVEMVTNQGTPVFAFAEEAHDFGVINEGTKAEHDFTFTNTGDAPLIISNAKGSCGCTVPQWPREPIAPGETGIIHVVFDSSGKPGAQTKQVTLNANTVPNTRVLTIKAQVTPKAETEAAANS